MPIVNKIGDSTIKETFDSTIEAVFTLHLAKKPITTYNSF